MFKLKLIIWNVNKNVSYHTNHTDFMYQRNATKNDNRRRFIIQQNYFTYQRKGNQELQIQALNVIVADLQNPINNITSNNPPVNNELEVGTMQNKKHDYYSFYICTNLWK